MFPLFNLFVSLSEKVDHVSMVDQGLIWEGGVSSYSFWNLAINSYFKAAMMKYFTNINSLICVPNWKFLISCLKIVIISYFKAKMPESDISILSPKISIVAYFIHPRAFGLCWMGSDTGIFSGPFDIYPYYMISSFSILKDPF